MKQFTLIILCVLVTGCASKKKIVTKKSDKSPKQETVDKVETPETPETPATAVVNSTTEYIEAFKPIAISEMELYGIPASITLAQGILESGSGRGRLAVQANNHFGIKCHGWNGSKIYHDDDRSQECFRKYEQVSQSFRDHSEFLVNRQRYAKLFNLKLTDYKGWARELRRAGYATDRKYPEKLISLIERYELFKYDQVDSRVVLTETAPAEHQVVKGDTLYSISKRYDVPVALLRKYNGLADNAIKIGQTLALKEKDRP